MIRNFVFLFLVFTGLVFTGLSLGVKEAQGNTEELATLKSKVSKFTLSNGIRVIVYKRDHAPVFSGNIWVKVGGVNEVPGTTGLAHFLEHMAFKGSETIGTNDYSSELPRLARLEELMLSRSALLAETRGAAKGSPELAKIDSSIEKVRAELKELWKPNEFSQIYKLRGAVGLNAGTSKDYTVYLVSLPSSAFDAWLWMESDRLLNPVFRQFYQEREVIQEERRSRVDDNPGGKLYETLLATAYLTHPNRLPVIGWPSDMKNLSATDMKDFYETYYRPDNMVISLAGDLDAAEIKPKLERYFGRIKPVDKPLKRIYTEEEPQDGERHAVIYDDAEPQFFMAYHKPTYPNKDDAQFAVLHEVLSSGRTSILYKELIQEKQLAVSVFSTEGPGQLHPPLMILGGSPKKGVSNEKLKNEIQKILDRLKETDISDQQLEAAKRRVRVDYLSAINSNSGMARSLGHAETLWGDWEVFLEVYGDILNTTKEDIRRLASSYLNVNNRTYVHLEKSE